MTKQSEIEEHMYATYIVRKKVSKRDLGIINTPKYYPKNKKKDRHYNNGVDHSLHDLKQLSFMLINLKPLYRNKILQSDQFKNVMENVMDIGVSKWHQYTKEEKDHSLAFTVQMLAFCFKVISLNMSEEFQKPLLNHIRPLNDLIKAIYSHMAKNNETLPPFRELGYPIDENMPNF